MDLKVGDYVTRSSYNNDLIFRIDKISENKVFLRGCRYRLLADAPLDDLVYYESDKNNINDKLFTECSQHFKRQQRNLVFNATRENNSSANCFKERPGSVLHLDGDQTYLELSMQNYRNCHIKAKGFFISEKDQADIILKHLKIFKPDILVLTGHDGNRNGDKRYNSNFFIRGIEIARNFISDLDQLVIFAGACQSSYQKLIDSGANFASSPEDKLLHFMEPVLVANKIACTSFSKIITAKDIQKEIINSGSVGGVETRGKMRLAFP